MRTQHAQKKKKANSRAIFRRPRPRDPNPRPCLPHAEHVEARLGPAARRQPPAKAICGATPTTPHGRYPDRAAQTRAPLKQTFQASESKSTVIPVLDQKPAHVYPFRFWLFCSGSRNCDWGLISVTEWSSTLLESNPDHVCLISVTYGDRALLPVVYSFGSGCSVSINCAWVLPICY